MSPESLNEVQTMYLRALEDAGCQFRYSTTLFGKPYVWMRDRAGNPFLERLPNE